MKYLTYSGNNIIAAKLPDDASIFYAPGAIPGLGRRDVKQAVRRSFENPLGQKRFDNGDDLFHGSRTWVCEGARPNASVRTFLTVRITAKTIPANTMNVTTISVPSQ